MGFSKGFEKTAFIGALLSGAARLGAGAIGAVARPIASTVGKAAVGAGAMGLRGAGKVLGGPIGTVMTGAQAVGDYKNYKNIMNGVQR